jgi:hypothetical protein
MDARQRLALSQRRNRRCFGPHDAQLNQLVKVNPGIGPPLTPHPASAGMLPAPVGTLYPAAMAPATFTEITDMTLAQISVLAEWANDDFGIRPGDDEGTRQAKLLHHYLNE